MNNEVSMQAPPTEEEINFRELFDIVWSGRYVVLAVLLLSIFLGGAYIFLAAPVYESRGLVQIEQAQNDLSKSVNQLSSLIGSSPGDAPAETAIIQSRMVLGVVADDLKLHIAAEPDFFPVVGRAIARRRQHLPSPVSAPFGLEAYAWGGEKIRVTSLDLPSTWNDQDLTLIALGEGKFRLYGPAGEGLLEGAAGVRSATADGTTAIFVQELVARAQTRFRVVRRSPQAVLSQVQAQLGVVEKPRDSGVIELTVKSTSPQMAAQLINSIQAAYLRQNVERRSAQAEQSLIFLKEQLPTLRAKVDEAQARLNSYQLSKGTVDVQRETELALSQSVSYETERLKLVQEREAALQRFTSQHPVIVAFNEQIRGLEQVQATLKKQVELLPETQQEVLSLMRDVEVNSQLYTGLLNSAQQLQVTKAGTIGNVRIIDTGLSPLYAIKPKKGIIVVLSILVGLLAGVLTVFAMRALLRGVDRPEQVERATGLATYATIPFTAEQTKITKGLYGESKRGRILAAENPNDISIEALRGLRTSLHFAMLESQNNIVMFTGPVAALGKSFVSINFATVLATAGKKVALVDADLRRGYLHRYAGLDNKKGVSDFVAGTCKLEEIIHSNIVAGMDFVSAGSRPPNPAEVLMNERFGNLLEFLSKSYDLVLIDTPPVLPVTDPAIIGRFAGTTLLVLKSGEHPLRAIEESVKRLRQAGVEIRGTIFNQVGARIGSYGYGTYGYSYGYSSYGYKVRQ